MDVKKMWSDKESELLLLIFSFPQHDCNTKFWNLSYSQEEENQLHNTATENTWRSFQKAKGFNLACA